MEKTLLHLLFLFFKTQLCHDRVASDKHTDAGCGHVVQWVLIHRRVPINFVHILFTVNRSCVAVCCEIL